MELFRAKVKVRFFHPGAALDPLRAKSKQFASDIPEYASYRYRKRMKLDEKSDKSQ